MSLADQEGLDALTMRRLGAALNVEAMSLYKHVANKDEILDGIVDVVISQIELPSLDAPWKDAMRARASSARQVFKEHSWAIGLLESRRPQGSAVPRYVNDILGNLRTAGFTIEQAVHAFWLLDSFVYGHVLQEASSSDTGGVPTGPEDDEGLADVFPYLAEVERHAAINEYSFDNEFHYGLELILDSLERGRAE